MGENSQNGSSKKALIIIGAILAGIILIFAVRAICITTAADHAYDKASKEYNKAYEKAQRDVDRAFKQYNF